MVPWFRKGRVLLAGDAAHISFTPTSGSWLNMVERFFRDLTRKGLRRGVFRDIEELITTIGADIDKHNERPKPFIWTAKAADIWKRSSARPKPWSSRWAASGDMPSTQGMSYV